MQFTLICSQLLTAMKSIATLNKKDFKSQEKTTTKSINHKLKCYNINTQVKHFTFIHNFWLKGRKMVASS